MKRMVNRSLDSEFDFFGLKGINFYICAGIMVVFLVIGLSIGGWLGISLFLVFCCTAYFGFIIFQSYHTARSFRLFLSSGAIPSFVYIRKGLRVLFKRI